MKLNLTFKKLGTFITVMTIFLVVEMVISTTLIANQSSKEALTEEIKRSLVLEAKTLASEVKQIVTFRFRQLSMLSGLDDLKTLNQGTKAEIKEKYNKILAQFSNLQKNETTLLNIAISNLQGEAINTDGKTYSVSDEPYFKEAIQGKQSTPYLVKDKETGISYIYYAIPYYNTQNLVSGTIILGVDGLAYCSYMSDVQLGSLHPYIFDSTGLLIGDADKNLVDSNYNILNNEPAKHDFIEKVITEDTSGVYGYKLNKESIIAGYAPVEETNWFVVAPMKESEAYESIFALLIKLSLIALVYIFVAVIVAQFIGRRISAPVSFVSEAVEKISQGDLVLEEFSQEKREKIMNRRDELGKLGRSLTDLLIGLTRIINQIKEISEKLSSGAYQMSSSSQQVSTGASEQAASTEEISATMEEITSNIKQNTENAITTAQIAEESMARGNKSAVAVQQTVSAMEEITSKIAIIDDIASQTNLLALNAAIEAARAGEAGKGFAVVASEIRQLAEKSQKAAGDISEVAKSSSEVAFDSGKLISELIPEIQKTGELVDEIAAASKEQNTGVQQVNKAILQMDHVVQQNASAAEQLAAMAEELNSQASGLLDVISFFKV